MSKWTQNAELDQEWVELLETGRQLGLSPQQIREFLRKQQMLNMMHRIQLMNEHERESVVF